MIKPLSLRDVIIRAWDNTSPCPDGSNGGFCPSCLYASVIKLLEEQEVIAEALRHGE
jgi:hypothetical protein